MPSANGNKWTDSAVKDLTFAILMSNGDGNFNVNANWDNVSATMKSWGYDFTKSAMTQHWTKRILKDFRERHADAAGPSGGSATSTPRAKGGRASTAGTPKTPSSSKAATKGKGAKGKGKRALEDDDDTNGGDDTPPQRTNSTVDPIARNKTPRASAKKLKYEEQDDDDDEDAGEKGKFATYNIHDTSVFRGPGQEDDAFDCV